MPAIKGVLIDIGGTVLVGNELIKNSIHGLKRMLLQGAQLIGIHKGKYYKTSTDLSLGPGPFLTALEHASGCKATIIGKPQKSFFEMAIKEFDSEKEGDFFMIGDDVTDDVDGAQKAGLKGILVKTGKYRSGDESKIDPPPYFIADCFGDAVDFLLKKPPC